MRLSKNFTLRELTRSDTARRHGLTNQPDQPALVRLGLLVNHVMQPLRDHFGRPLRVTSGYRGPMLNRLVGGSRRSDHMWGRANDFEDWLDDRWNYEYGLWIQENLEFKQLIWEFGGEWLHVSYHQGHNRGQVIEAFKDSEGKTRYRPFRFETDSILRVS